MHAVAQTDDSDGTTYHAVLIKGKGERPDEEPEVYFEGKFKGGAVDGEWNVSGWRVSVPSGVADVIPPLNARVRVKAQHDRNNHAYEAFEVKFRGGGDD